MNDAGGTRRTIYFLNSMEGKPDAVQELELITQIGYFGYQVKSFQDLDQLEQAIHGNVPDGLVLYWNFSPLGGRTVHEKERVVQSLQEIARDSDTPPAVVVLSHQEDVEARLEAVRLGGQAFFALPVDSGTVIDALDRLICKERIMPYRVLIVDDSIVAARFAQSTLQKAGMITEIVSQPLTVMSAVLDFNPDLILLDMYMPECTGMELARVIRQMEKFVSIPIVYLSSEEDKDMQLEAMSIGADDFINKMDLKRHHLIGAVQSRVERYRKLRSMMIRDSLTGLLNHTTVIERIDQELARTKRSRTSGKDTYMALAMLDIDLFKTVNDNYGHATGDRVLRSLSRFLQQRLRQSDSVGRYGGEEFAVVLPDTDSANALVVINEIRNHFSQIRHQSEAGEFSVTFSCGVAVFPDFNDPLKIIEAADHAMYTAKREGRNRVVLAKAD